MKKMIVSVLYIDGMTMKNVNMTNLDKLSNIIRQFSDILIEKNKYKKSSKDTKYDLFRIRKNY